MKKKILIIDDEQQIRHFMRVSFTAEGYQSIEAENGVKGLALLKQENPNLVVLDLGLPDVDGYYVLREIRQSSKIPVLVLTARDQESVKVKLLEGGANDYLCKPFGVRELIARIKVLLRDIVYEPTPGHMVFDGLVVKPKTLQVEVDGKPIKLSKKEFALLFHLAEKPGVLVTRTELLVAIWGATHAEDTHYLRVLITQLRKKLNDDADAPRFIATEPGIGYRLVAKALKGGAQ